jgi:uncharacterized membrane protein YbhN (UPF0104 family)
MGGLVDRLLAGKGIMSIKKIISVVVGLAGTALFLWLALRDVHYHELIRHLSAANWQWIIPMAAIVYIDIFIRAVRWRVLLSRACPHASVWELTRLEAIGLGVNNVLFLRLGELARGVLASRRLGVPLLAALASVVVERALDVCALLSIFILASSIAPGFVPDSVRLGAQLVLFGGIVALSLLAWAETAVASGGFIERLLRPWPRIHSLMEQLALGATVLRDPRAAIWAGVLSVALWSMDALLYWAGAHALGLESIMSYPRAILALSWAGASSALPAAPGAIGSFEKIVATIVHQFGATSEQALAYALVCHMVMYILVTVTGLVLLYRIGLSLADLKSEVEKK